jgi:methylamine dehydrogenase accessory protein MauD
MSFVITSQVLLWIAIAVLSVIVIALARQIGVLHERIAPVGALKVDSGPAVGDKAPVFTLPTVSGGLAHIGLALEKGRAQLLLFVSPDCPVCKNLIPVAKSFARNERLNVLFVGDGELAAQRRMIEHFALNPAAFVNSPEVGMRFGVGKLPYAVLIDDAGVVAASGLVNSREHLESLVVAQEMGMPSVQAYLRSTAGNHSAT